MKIVIDMFIGLLGLVGKLCGVLLLVCVVPFLVSGLLWLFWFCVIKKMKIPKRKFKCKQPKYTIKRNALLRLLWDFPRRFVLDKLTFDPDRFGEYGIHVFCGEQGSGKSIAAVHFIKCLRERFPGCKVASNIDLDCMDVLIDSSDEIINSSNGALGQIVYLDEIQNWFSSMESKNFPPEMLTEVTQQRKQSKIIVGTSQVFNRISKPIREQITLLYKPTTICGCLTIVRVYRAHVSQDGAIDKERMLRMYFFVHDDELRNAYDTYAKVLRMQKSGYIDYNKRVG